MSIADNKQVVIDFYARRAEQFASHVTLRQQ